MDVKGARRQGSTEGLLGTLRALGAPLETSADIASALRERRQHLWEEPTDPVLVAWQGQTASMEVRLPAHLADRPIDGAIRLETGVQVAAPLRGARRTTLHRARVEGRAYVSQRVELPLRHLRALPVGYHELTIEIDGRSHPSLLLLAPIHAYRPAAHDRASGSARTWGVFLPLYALHSATSWGAGDFGDLHRLMDWTAGLGGGVVATLPLLAAFLDEPYDPSPYAPVSRLFWNEFYVDPGAIPELGHCTAAQRALGSPRLKEACGVLRSASLVDYRRQMALKREVLEHLAAAVVAPGAPRAEDFRRYVSSHPLLQDYARFRAAGEGFRSAWQQWPAGARNGMIGDADVDPAALTYHLYAQWVAHEQVSSLAEQASRAGEGLYLDLPLGVHRQGYDVWRERASFVLEASGGAPPDSVFTKGQDWGFAPLHPQGIRRSRYRYVIAFLRHHMSLAKVLRVDHVMGLHRLYMIPRGLEAAQGVYVRYRAEELYAILSIESHRHRTWLVGENLGTVPAHVNASLARHAVHGMYVVQYEITPKARPVLREVPRQSVASMNTHDMPPFAAYCRGLDLDDRLIMGLMTQSEADQERRVRGGLLRKLGAQLRRKGLVTEENPGAAALLDGCLAFLSQSRAPLVLVNLEDLWLEMEPQNVPDSKESRPNWARKAAYALEAFSDLPQVIDLLGRVDQFRRGAQAGRRTARSKRHR